MNNLRTKTAFVTGGAQGIGKGIVLTLAAAGANIVIGDLDQAKAEAVVAEVKKLGVDAIALALDITNTDSISDCIQQALKHFACIDILVNNAGVVAERGGVALTEQVFDRTLDVNLKGVWRVSAALIPHFKTNHNGKIINIASINGRQVDARLPGYSASKAAVISLTQSLAVSLGADNITVNAVCPGGVWTPMAEAFIKDSGLDPENGKQAHLDGNKNIGALKRNVEPEDIGHAVVFFASSQAKNITGQALNVDGGYVMS